MNVDEAILELRYEQQAQRGRRAEALAVAIDALACLRELHEYVEIDPETEQPYEDPDDGPSAADQCEVMYDLLGKLGLEVS